MNRKVFIRLIIIIGGIAVILIALFAFQLGLDNNPELGTNRIRLLAGGIALILFASLHWLTPIVNRAFNLKNKNTHDVQNKPINNKLNNILLIVLCSFSIWVYVWVITIGKMDKFPSGKDYYWRLTQAFQQGQTHLLETPNPELQNLENVYDFHQRKGMDYLWDATYYDGKYFLYWGPVPAILGIFINAITSQPIPDAGFVLGFVIGITIFSILLLYQIYKTLKIPSWAFWGGVLASSINMPLIWLLTRPSVYEVSIAGGQFFLLAGFYFLFLGLKNSQINLGYLTASALTFGLAGATRINLLPSIIVLSAIVLLKIYLHHQKKIRAALPAFTLYLLPLLCTAVFLCWYNFQRFGSIFEFGHRYQLTGPALTANYKDIGSAQYILPNIYSYFFRPPQLTAEFPFLLLPDIKQHMWPPLIHLPKYYNYTEPVAGIFIITPLISLALLVFIRKIWLIINEDISTQPIQQNSETNLSFWFQTSLLAYILIQLFILLIFLYAAMRYLVDISPALIILSTLATGYHTKKFEHPYWQKIIAFAWIISALLTIIMGFIIGISGDRNNFLNQNPALFYQMREWFNK